MASTINATTSSGIVATADNTGSLQLQAAGTTKFTVDSTGAYGQIQSGTAQASTSGSTITFTGIPSWAKRVTMLFNGVSFSGSDNFLVQVGSGSLTTSGYSNVTGYSGVTTGTITGTTGILIASGGNAGDLTNGQITFYNISGNTWVASGATSAGTAANYFSIPAGSVTLSGALDRIAVKSTISDTFDAGTINILYE